MKRHALTLGLALASLIFTSSTFAREEQKEKLIAVIGHVVDTGCYVTHDTKGPEHANCAATCAKNGVPLAILDDSGKLYMPIAMDHKNQNLKLAPFIEKKVKIIGTASKKGGLTGIAIKTVEPAE